MAEPVDIEIQKISPNQQVLSRQATVKAISGSGNSEIKVQGYIIPDPNRDHAVSARISGRIEKLYIKFSGQRVSKGDKIMDLYSPDLLTFQEEHLFLLRTNSDKTLKENSRKKLMLLGMLEDQVRQLENKGTVSSTISIYSPEKGFVFFDAPASPARMNKEKSPEGSSMNMQGDGEDPGSFTPDKAQIREGTYINEGQMLFTVNDLKVVWALASISGHYADQVIIDGSVPVVTEDAPSKKLPGKIVLVEPTFEEAEQRFMRVRIALSNSDLKLKVNSLITAQLALMSKEGLFVPASAVYKTGRQAFVWVKTDTTQLGTGIFRLRGVITGSAQNGNIPVFGGLDGDEEIAKEAGLMVDSETILKIN